MISNTILKSVLLILVCCLTYNNGVEGKRMKLSRRENLELEEELRLLNKPAVETVWTKSGEKYGCVDFYKQPAFDHPALQNYTAHPQMKPSFLKELEKREDNHLVEAYDIWINGKGCPIGTVPIKKVTKRDLIRSKLLASTMSHLAGGVFGSRRAVVRTKNDGKQYSGASATFSVYNPSIFENDQYTAAQNGLDAIQTGWIVNPMVYGDNKTRTFIYTKIGGKSQCFNVMCSGFVLSGSMPTDRKYNQSPKEEERYTNTHFTLFGSDPINGVPWYLTFGKEVVGWWPTEVFTRLSSNATYIEWGGLAYTTRTQPLPEMGSGLSPVIRPGYLYPDPNLYAYGLSLMTANAVDAMMVNATNTEGFSDDPKSYNVIDLGFAKGQESYGHTMFYGGGPGVLEVIDEYVQMF